MSEKSLEEIGAKKMDNKDKKNKGEYRGVTKFEFQLLWTALWLVAIIGLCAMFSSAAPLWLLILWFFGSKW